MLTLPPAPLDDTISRHATLICSTLVRTPPEERFDRITRITSALFGTPIAAINLLDTACLWTKSGVGVAPGYLSLDIAFCTYAIAQNETLIVPDLREDPRFCNNPLVADPPYLRFYAGVPLRNAEGNAWGTLCVADVAPRTLGDVELKHLRDLACWAEREMAATELSEVLLRQQTMEAALRESEMRYRTVLGALAEGVVLQDEAGAISAANASAERILGLSKEELTGRTNMDPRWHAVRDDGTPFPGEEHPSTIALSTGQPQSGVLMGIEKPDGTLTWLSVSARPLFHPDATLPYAVVASFADVTKQKQIEQQLLDYQQQLESYNAELSVLATTDGLTGITNKRTFSEILEMEVERALLANAPLSLILLDVDYFKSYNDTFGHPAGDVVLQQVAQLLRSSARGTDMVARYGGEEFAILLPHTDAIDAYRVAERLRRRIAEYSWPNRDVTASLGVAAITTESVTSGSLLEAADQALYYAKQQGRNRVAYPVR